MDRPSRDGPALPPHSACPTPCGMCRRGSRSCRNGRQFPRQNIVIAFVRQSHSAMVPAFRLASDRAACRTTTVSIRPRGLVTNQIAINHPFGHPLCRERGPVEPCDAHGRRRLGGILRDLQRPPASTCTRHAIPTWSLFCSRDVGLQEVIERGADHRDRGQLADVIPGRRDRGANDVGGQLNPPSRSHPANRIQIICRRPTKLRPIRSGASLTNASIVPQAIMAAAIASTHKATYPVQL